VKKPILRVPAKGPGPEKRRWNLQLFPKHGIRALMERTAGPKRRHQHRRDATTKARRRIPNAHKAGTWLIIAGPIVKRLAWEELACGQRFWKWPWVSAPTASLTGGWRRRGCLWVPRPLQGDGRQVINNDERGGGRSTGTPALATTNREEPGARVSVERPA